MAEEDAAISNPLAGESEAVAPRTALWHILQRLAAYRRTG